MKKVKVSVVQNICKNFVTTPSRYRMQGEDWKTNNEMIYGKGAPVSPHSFAIGAESGNRFIQRHIILPFEQIGDAYWKNAELYRVLSAFWKIN